MCYSPSLPRPQSKLNEEVLNTHVCSANCNCVVLWASKPCTVTACIFTMGLNTYSCCSISDNHCNAER